MEALESRRITMAARIAATGSASLRGCEPNQPGRRHGAGRDDSSCASVLSADVTMRYHCSARLTSGGTFRRVRAEKPQVRSEPVPAVEHRVSRAHFHQREI